MKLIHLVFTLALTILCFNLIAQKDTTRKEVRFNQHNIQLDTIKLKTVGIDNPKNWYESNAMPWLIALIIGVLTVITNIFISLYTRKTSITIAKKQITNTGITQFRQNWIDGLREAISLYVAKAEMISMVDLDDDESYDKHFLELSQMHYKIELLLNPLEEDHLEVVRLIGQIREIIHDEEIDPDKMDKELENLIALLMKVTKSVLKREWNVVKQGK